MVENRISYYEPVRTVYETMKEDGMPNGDCYVCRIKADGTAMRVIPLHTVMDSFAYTPSCSDHQDTGGHCQRIGTIPNIQERKLRSFTARLWTDNSGLANDVTLEAKLKEQGI